MVHSKFQNSREVLSRGLSPDLKLCILCVKKTIPLFQAKSQLVLVKEGLPTSLGFTTWLYSQLAKIQASPAVTLSFAEVVILYFDTKNTWASPT